MSKKTLLNENTIRRFWKLASIRPINEMEYLRDEEEEEVLEPALDEPPVDLGDEEVPADDLGAGGEIEAEVTVQEEDVPSLETAVKVLQDILAVAGTGEEEIEPELDADVAPVDDLEAEEVPSPLEEHTKEEEEEEPVEENKEADPVDAARLEEVVKTITDRVTKRILRAALVNKINKK